MISSDRPPKAMATLEDRLRSRFGWGLITDVQPPDLETRLAILRKKAEREPTLVTDDVLAFIATHITNNIRELEGALNRVLAFSSLNGVPLTLQMAEDVLGDLITAKAPRQITAKVILDATADMFGISVDDLRGKSRSRPLVTARQVAMYVLREMTDFSYPAIGREFGDRDHTTVMHAVAKISELMRERRTIYDQVTELMHRRCRRRWMTTWTTHVRRLLTPATLSTADRVRLSHALWEAGDAAWTAIPPPTSAFRGCRPQSTGPIALPQFSTS